MNGERLLDEATPGPWSTEHIGYTGPEADHTLCPESSQPPCPSCGHDIDQHGPMDGCFWWELNEPKCLCDMRPSSIARVLLTAEPTEAEVEAAAEAITDVLMDDGHNGLECRIERPLDYTAASAARVALRAARGLS